MNVCIRCGKKRIVSSSYTEVVNGSKVIYTMTICPDPDCQKLVEEKLKVEAIKRKAFREEQEKRSQEEALARNRRRNISYGKTAS